MPKIKLQGEAEKKRNIYFIVDTDDTPIGEGGMGRVFKGHCVDATTNVSRPVAIKCLFDNLSPNAIDRARREANIRLRNDNLIEMMGFIETENVINNSVVKHYHVASELLHGVTLSDLFDGKCCDQDGNVIPFAEKMLNERKNNPVSFAKAIVSNVLTGLVALHDAGYIHRDIDPTNIMLTEDGHIKLIDFGIAKQVSTLTTHDRILTTAGVFMGKAEYAAPELVLGDTRHQTTSTDIYAMGILLYHCLVGHPPFEGATNTVLDYQLHKSIPLSNIKDKGLRKIIRCATDKEHTARYQTASQMRVAMENLDGLTREMNAKTKRKILILSLVASIIVGVSITSFIHHSNVKKQEFLEAQIAHNDSLARIIGETEAQADKHYDIGKQHGENYEEHLINALQTYRLALKASNNMKSIEGVKAFDNKSIVDKIHITRTALEKARVEIKEKEAYFLDSGDKDIAQTFTKMINTIDNILKTQD